MSAYFFEMRNPVEDLKYSLKPARYVIALSGGADSMALAVACVRLQMEHSGYRFVAVHVEHGLRGEESLRDRDFVVQFCKACNLEYVVKSVDVPGRVKETGQSVEEAARELRYRALTDVAMRVAARKILTAHHADDQAETVLLHMVRGAGIRGLGAMKKDNGFIARPLLNYSKQELVEYCQQSCVNWVEDSTNNDVEFSRNYVRQKVMPLLLQLNPQTVDHLCQLANLAREDEEVLQQWANQLLTERLQGDALDVRDWHLVPKAIRRRILRNWLAKLHVEGVTLAHINAVDNLILTGTSNKEVALPGITVRYAYHGVYGLRDKQHIRH